MDRLKFITKILHTRYAKEDVYGSLRMPVYDTAAFEYAQAEDIEAAFAGTQPGHVYSRSSNPTVEHFERVLMNATGSLGVIAFSSGMAAISNLIFSLASNGDNIITTKNLFGNTYSLFETTLKPFGIEFRYVDLANLRNIEEYIDENTRAVFFETISNPQLEVVDIKALSQIARKYGLVLIADTTLTPPYIFDSKKHGVDIEVLSATKYISGGATSIGGVIIDNGIYDWIKIDKLSAFIQNFGPFALLAKLRKEIFRNTGACLSPHNAYLQTLGLETLPLRAELSCSNTLKIAEFLKEIPGVTKVNYPGLNGSKYFTISSKQFLYPGALLTFELTSKKQCFQFMNKLNIIRRATNLNDNKTLILHPASTIFCEYDEVTRNKLGVSDNMLRLAVGIEDIEDLIFDITNALK